MTSKDASGLAAPSGMVRNEPPLLKASPGCSQTCHLPAVSGSVDHQVCEVPGCAEVGGQATLADGGRGVGGVRLERGDDARIEGPDGRVPGVADVLLVTDEGAGLIDEALAGLLPHGVEQAAGVADEVGVGLGGEELLAQLDVLVPGADRSGELLRIRREAGLLEDVEAVEERGGADVDRDAKLLAVLGGGLGPLVLEVVALDVFGAQRVEVDEVLRLALEEGDVLALHAGDVGQARARGEGGGELLLEIATDDVLAHLVLRELGGDGVEGLLAEALGPGPEDQVHRLPGGGAARAGRGARARCRRRAANQAAEGEGAEARGAAVDEGSS